MSYIPEFRIYRGRSMKGTFRPGDCLFFEPDSIYSISLGDIVIYSGVNRDGEAKEFVHRVISAKPDGFTTRGDNNRYIDSIIVEENNLIGKVNQFERNGKKRTVCGGQKGLLWVRLLRLRLFFFLLLKWIFRFPYKLLRKSKIISHIWHPNIKKIYLKTDRGDLIKYICRGRTVADHWIEKEYFVCKKPYYLVLKREEEKSLE